MSKSLAQVIDSAIAMARKRLVNLDYVPGHFYSPIVNRRDIAARQNDIFTIPDDIPGIDLNEAGQLETLDRIKLYYAENGFPKHRTEGYRYYFENEYYSYSDALFLYCVIRYFKPRRIIEAGSGFSSAVMLDTNERFFDRSISMTFVDPHPQRLYGLLKPGDAADIVVQERTLQSLPIDTFAQLGENDILFIDSTHVSKAGSDVNRVLFEIMPRLNPGVLIHFHDIFYPFEYPSEWVLGWRGFGWNEDYLLKAFMMYNDHFKIELFNTYLEHVHEAWFKENMPKCLLNRGGSIWIRKVD